MTARDPLRTYGTPRSECKVHGYSGRSTGVLRPPGGVIGLNELLGTACLDRGTRGNDLRASVNAKSVDQRVFSSLNGSVRADVSFGLCRMHLPLMFCE